jgi:hypothetical protein
MSDGYNQVRRPLTKITKREVAGGLMHLSRFLALMASVCLLYSCGGSGSSAPPNPIQGPSPGGIWRGTDTASGLAITGFVDETGFGEFMRADNAVFQGQVSTSASNSIFMDADGYPQSSVGFPDGSRHGLWTVAGTIQERQTVSATSKFTSDNGTETQGTLQLTFDALYDQPSSLATVACGYLVGAGSLSIASDGSISGHEPTIGDYSGQISLIDPAYNLYRVQLGLSGNVSKGLATLDNTLSPSRLRVVGLSGGGTYSWVDTWYSDTAAC